MAASHASSYARHTYTYTNIYYMPILKHVRIYIIHVSASYIYTYIEIYTQRKGGREREKQVFPRDL